MGTKGLGIPGKRWFFAGKRQFTDINYLSFLTKKQHENANSQNRTKKGRVCTDTEGIRKTVIYMMTRWIKWMDSHRNRRRHIAINNRKPRRTDSYERHRKGSPVSSPPRRARAGGFAREHEDRSAGGMNIHTVQSAWHRQEGGKATGLFRGDPGLLIEATKENAEQGTTRQDSNPQRPADTSAQGPKRHSVHPREQRWQTSSLPGAPPPRAQGPPATEGVSAPAGGHGWY